jgi:hypothetical protein
MREGEKLKLRIGLMWASRSNSEHIADDSLRRAPRRGSLKSVRGMLRGSRRMRSRLEMMRIRTVSVSYCLRDFDKANQPGVEHLNYKVS